jgi:hypothetical protein
MKVLMKIIKLFRKSMPAASWRVPIFLSCVTLALIELSSCSNRTPWDDHGPLQVSANKRYLEHQDGTPFIWIGGTAWMMFQKLRREEVDHYLDDRKAKGFTVIHGCAFRYPPAMAHHNIPHGPNNPTNFYGHRPFEGDVENPDVTRPLVVSGGSPTSPNDYWDHVDYIVNAVKSRGMYLAFIPTWARAYMHGIPDGAKILFDANKARNYGEFLGARYKNQPHMIWIMGGDVNPTANDVDQRGTYRAMAEGVIKGITGQSVAWNQNHTAWNAALMTYFPDGGPLNSSTWFHSDPWLDFNSVETHRHRERVFDDITKDYELNDPVKPTLLWEGQYEGTHSPGNATALQIRQQGYQAILAGAFGYSYGAERNGNDGHLIWFGPGWKNCLDLPGAGQMQHIKTMLKNNAWHTLVPDQSIITSGIGSADTIKVAARSDTRALVYFSNTSSATVRNPFSGTTTATWFDPRDANTIDAGSFASGESRSLIPPSGWEDAVLILVER